MQRIRAMMLSMATPPPPLSSRLADVRSSPVRDILELTQRAEVISFAGGLPAPELFPAELIADAFSRALAPTVAARALQYSATDGDPQLRELLAARFTARGLATDARDVLVTTGSQQALGLISSVLVDPGDVVLVENPSYLAALQCFGFAGARLVPVACDEQGLDPDALPALIAEHAPKFLYVVPTFQNPTGRTLPTARRARLAEVAADHGLWIVEDDPYGELRYDGEPLAPIGSHPAAGDRTITISSLSKVLAPGLRLGWLRAPQAILGPLTIAKQAADLHTSTVDQHAARIALQAADLDEHIGRIRAEYRRRRDAMLDGLPRALPAGSTFNRPDGGMFVWARLPPGWDASTLLQAALQHDVAFVPGHPFFARDADPRTLRLSFTTHVPSEISEGLRRLGRAAAA
ncbi:MAG TPA: PLP-dependent aminotransferase family protein [Solirubrobacteraceae bacterium]|jgi:2-aminoadipate transaminase|nr:PLP-dependent aminotransferase family protein [Solirubrobacteraceae bacterium]